MALLQAIWNRQEDIISNLLNTFPKIRMSLVDDLGTVTASVILDDEMMLIEPLEGDQLNVDSMQTYGACVKCIT